MTNRDAIKTLAVLREELNCRDEYKENTFIEKQIYVDAINLAIDVLGAQGSEAGRKGIFIPDITVEMFRNGSLEGIENLMAEGEILDVTIPSTDRHGEWILCNEKTPEEHEWIGTKEFGTTISKEVYVTFEKPDGQRFARHLSFQNGKIPPYEQREIEVFHKGAVPIAWKPLPEPYKGGDEE